VDILGDISFLVISYHNDTRSFLNETPVFDGKSSHSQRMALYLSTQGLIDFSLGKNSMSGVLGLTGERRFFWETIESIFFSLYF
jgi:hypothetical protein